MGKSGHDYELSQLRKDNEGMASSPQEAAFLPGGRREEPLKPCPFPHKVERGVFVDRDEEDFFVVRVSCSDCGCAGPYVPFDENWPDRADAEATRLWNQRDDASEPTKRMAKIMGAKFERKQAPALQRTPSSMGGDVVEALERALNHIAHSGMCNKHVASYCNCGASYARNAIRKVLSTLNDEKHIGGMAG